MRKSLAAFALTALVAAPLMAPQSAGAVVAADGSYTFGVIGDVPYGDAKVAEFPAMIDDLRQQTDLEFLTHVGDIKAGSARCDDSYFEMVRTQFDRLTMPLIYTPGDNEWVDCHRKNNGSYNPLERLDAIRKTFFPVAGQTLGRPMQVTSQAGRGLPENVQYAMGDIQYAVISVQGSNNSLKPWDGLGQTAATPEQLNEVQVRTAANHALLDAAFANATKSGSRAVVIMTQADMFDPSTLAAVQADPSQVSGLAPTVKKIADLTRAFPGEVYLFNGDSHIFNADNPLKAGSPWLDIYGIAPVDKLQRVTVEGDKNNDEWLRVTVTPKGSAKALTWQRVPYYAPRATTAPTPTPGATPTPAPAPTTQPPKKSRGPLANTGR